MRAIPAPAWDRLDQLAVPTLVLCGELDAVPLPASEHLTTHVAGATFEVLAGTARLPRLEGHARTFAAIDEFLTPLR